MNCELMHDIHKCYLVVPYAVIQNSLAIQMHEKGNEASTVHLALHTQTRIILGSCLQVNFLLPAVLGHSTDFN